MKYLKRLIMSIILLYTYNLLAVNVNMIIPINLTTICSVSFLGIPGFFVLVLFRTFM